MEKQQKKRIKKYISWCLAIAMVALLTCLPLIAANNEEISGPQASALSDTAQYRDITTQILGGGTLAAQDAVEITILAQVKLTEYLVRNGDQVSEGQPIASVDRVTVMTAITQVQETLEYLREQLEEASDKKTSDKVTATAGGTVKIIYGQPGERVQDVMLRDGALAVLSLDGLMAVKVERRTNLEVGEKVLVVFADDTEAEGKVASNLEGVLTVTLDDEGFVPGEKVTVTTEDGDRIGTGELYIHSQWNAVAYSGTISRVRVGEGDRVSAGKSLFELENTGVSPEFEMLTRQHREYEELMLELFRMYQSRCITAPEDGMILGVDESGTYMLSEGGAGWTVSLLVNAPNGNDEITYVNYIGKVDQVGIDGLVLMMNPQAVSVTDYMDLSAVPMDETLMTESALYTANAPVYELKDGAWIQIGMEDIVPGDILLFAGDAEGNFVWVVRVKSGEERPGEPAPSDPTEPTVPSEPDATEPSGSGNSGFPEGSFPQGGGNMGGFGGMSGMGGMTQQEIFELYGLDTVTVATVTPQSTMTLEITVDELDISRIYVGQSALMTVSALTGEKFTAEITGISASGENSGGNSKFTLELTVDKTVDMLPGMNASVAIAVDTAQQILCVPVAALVEDGNRTLVYTSYDQEKETYGDPVEVTVGISDGEYAQILSGLSEGQRIHYPYYDTLVISDAPDLSGGFPFGR